MTLLLVHHAAALDPRADARRPLSAEGLAAASRLATAVAARGFVPEAIWHSGKLRARQTAEAVWLAGDHRAAMTAARGLQPDDPPGWERIHEGSFLEAVLLTQLSGEFVAKLADP